MPSSAAPAWQVRLASRGRECSRACGRVRAHGYVVVSAWTRDMPSSVHILQSAAHDLIEPTHPSPSLHVSRPDMSRKSVSWLRILNLDGPSSAATHHEAYRRANYEVSSAGRPHGTHPSRNTVAWEQGASLSPATHRP
jgi:hypothetical protein